MKNLRKNLTHGVKFFALFLTLSLASCGESSTQSNDGQGAGSQADQGTNEAQGPHTGAGHSATGGADTLGNAKVGEAIDTSAIQRGLDTVNTIPGNGSNKKVPAQPNKQ